MLGIRLARRAASQAMRIGTDTQSEDKADRAKQMGQSLRVRDDRLWNPFEVVALVFLVIFAFGFLLGRSNYLFVIELFSPVILIGVAILAYQIVQRWRARGFGLLGQVSERLR